MPISRNAATLLDLVAGFGVPEDAGFNIIKLLQSNSPEVSRRDPKYVQGAEAGDFCFHGKEQPIVQGEVGFVMLPLAIKRLWVEWLPGRAGFVAQHVEKPLEAHHDQDENGRQILRMLASGNVIEETFYLICAIAAANGLIDGDDVWALSLRSTGITVLRNKFVAPLDKLRIDVNRVRKQPPIFGSKWQVSSERTGNQEGSWYTYRFTLLGKVGDPEGPTEEEFQIGCDLHQSFAPSALPTPLAGSALPPQTARPQGKIAIRADAGRISRPRPSRQAMTSRPACGPSRR